MTSMNQGLLELGQNEKHGPLESNSFQWYLSSPTRTLKWLIHVARRCFALLLIRPASPPRDRPLRPTAWLDGLRGFAAFLVYMHHHQLWVHAGTNGSRIMEHPYGWDNEFHFATFPYIRIFFTGGHFAVATFYVISGYVLSAKAMVMIHSKDYEKLSEVLASSLFRRWFRLFLPVFGTTFVWMTSWHAFGLWTPPFEPMPSYIEEFHKWYDDVKSYSYLFQVKSRAAWVYYNLHTWSIPYEYRGSIMVYTSLLALSRASKRARLWCCLGLILYFLYITDGWSLALFMSGMVLCDLDLLAAKGELPSIMARLEPQKDLIYSGLLGVAFYLGSVPEMYNNYDNLKQAPGWRWLSLFKPAAMEQPKWFYLFFASTLLVASIPRLLWLKDFFNTRFCQYLGRISYALYLVHGPVIWTLGDKVYLMIGWAKDSAYMNEYPSYFNSIPISKVGPLGLEPATILPHLILIPFTFWIANLVTIIMDEPSVKFAAWLHQITFPRNG